MDENNETTNRVIAMSPQELEEYVNRGVHSTLEDINIRQMVLLKQRRLDVCTILGLLTISIVTIMMTKVKIYFPESKADIGNIQLDATRKMTVDQKVSTAKDYISERIRIENGHYTKYVVNATVEDPVDTRADNITVVSDQPSSYNYTDQSALVSTASQGETPSYYYNVVNSMASYVPFFNKLAKPATSSPAIMNATQTSTSNKMPMDKTKSGEVMYDLVEVLTDIKNHYNQYRYRIGDAEYTYKEWHDRLTGVDRNTIVGLMYQIIYKIVEGTNDIFHLRTPSYLDASLLYTLFGLVVSRLLTFSVVISIIYFSRTYLLNPIIKAFFDILSFVLFSKSNFSVELGQNTNSGDIPSSSSGNATEDPLEYGNQQAYLNSILKNLAKCFAEATRGDDSDAGETNAELRPVVQSFQNLSAPNVNPQDRQKIETRFTKFLKCFQSSTSSPTDRSSRVQELSPGEYGGKLARGSRRSRKTAKRKTKGKSKKSKGKKGKGKKRVTKKRASKR